MTDYLCYDTSEMEKRKLSLNKLNKDKQNSFISISILFYKIIYRIMKCSCNKSGDLAFIN